MDIKTLENLGLSNTEAKVYLALLELGSVTANKVAERSGIHRRTVYDILETLIEKGLVSFVIEANKKYYQAEDPKKFIDLLEDRKKDFENALPELIAMKGTLKQEVGVYRGKKGLKNISDDMLTAKTIHTLGSSGKFKEIVGDIYYEKWINKLNRLGIKLKIIMSKGMKKEKFPKKVEARYVEETYTLPTSTTIYDDKVLIFILTEQPLGIMIKSKETAESYLKYFNMLWDIAKA